MEFKAMYFDELTNRQVYEILRSRSEIFMLEQEIRCLDMDGVDYQSRHFFLEDNGRVCAYLRAFYQDRDTVKIGRVLTLRHGDGLGRLLMEQSLADIQKTMPCKKIRLDSQVHANGFYEKFGFCVVSEPFMEEGVLHCMMERTNQE